jgi:hypothetical protein
VVEGGDRRGREGHTGQGHPPGAQQQARHRQDGHHGQGVQDAGPEGVVVEEIRQRAHERRTVCGFAFQAGVTTQVLCDGDQNPREAEPADGGARGALA